MGFDGFMLLVFIVGFLYTRFSLPVVASLATRCGYRWTWNATLVTVILSLAGFAACMDVVVRYGVNDQMMYTDLVCAFLSGIFVGPAVYTIGAHIGSKK